MCILIVNGLRSRYGRCLKTKTILHVWCELGKKEEKTEDESYQAVHLNIFSHE
jgi:hypothetical protein